MQIRPLQMHVYVINIAQYLLFLVKPFFLIKLEKLDGKSDNRSRRNSTSSTSSSSSSLSGGASGKTPASASGSAVPSYLLASGTAEGDKFGCDNGYELPLSEHLRPGLVVRVIGAINRSDYIVYVIRVCDVQSGVEWRTERRFREFQEFHDVVVSLRPSIARIEFPRKRYDSGHYLLLNYLSHHRK